MTIELTPEEVRLLDELLSLDLEKIGFEDDDVNILEGILPKLGQK